MFIYIDQNGKIHDNSPIELSDVEIEYRAAKGINLTYVKEIPDDFSKIWDFTTSSWIDDILKAKNKKISEIKLSRQAFQYQDLTIDGQVFKATQSAKVLFFLRVNGAVTADYPIKWRLSDDITWVELDKTSAYQLYAAMAAQETSAYQQESTFISAVNEATTIEELDTINIKFK